MRYLKLLFILFSAVACAEQKDGENNTKAKGPMQVVQTAPTEPTEKVVKTEEEWKEILTPEQYRVARTAGTERANSDTYKQYKDQGTGTYYCAACDAKLFHSKTKINANCGWPAFYDAESHENVVTKEDHSHGMKRVEVLCAKCDAHLGHIFEGEGYDTPTDQRYCINGVILKFVPDVDPAKKTAEVKDSEEKTDTPVKE
ncbi:peptide-methionine (R)-S-oxide reductase MsrB [Akkermansiaceae bacterium]|nr:peptide-methionine (R)-S-oxide reductase MsrB [Akkermansiaceae bacterium]